MRAGNSRATGRNRRLVLSAMALLLMVVAAATLPGSFAWSRRAARDPLLVPEMPAFAVYVLLAIGAVGMVFVAFAAITPRASDQFRARRTPVWIQILIVVLALFLAAQIGDTQDLFGREQAGEVTPETNPSSARRPEGPTALRSRPLGLLITSLLVVVLVAMVAVLAWLLWPERPPFVGSGEDPLLEGIEAGAEDLARLSDPRRAVIACYARMERVLQAAGLPRQPSDTPLELLARVLRNRAAPEPYVARLTELFERAKYSPHDIDETMRIQALEALAGVREHIAARRTDEPAGVEA